MQQPYQLLEYPTVNQIKQNIEDIREQHHKNFKYTEQRFKPNKPIPHNNEEYEYYKQSITPSSKNSQAKQFKFPANKSEQKKKGLLNCMDAPNEPGPETNYYNNHNDNRSANSRLTENIGVRQGISGIKKPGITRVS